MKFVFTIVLLLISVLGAAAQTPGGGATLNVVVKRTEVLKSRQAVTVVILKDGVEIARKDGFSDDDFRFDGLAAGVYGVKVIAAEKASHALPGVVEVTIVAGRPATAEFTVYPATASMPQMTPLYERVTIAADYSQTFEQVTKSVNVISGQEMRDRADFSLAESLRTIPGFRVQQLGGFGRTATIKTRGLRNQDTAVLIDGVRFRDASSITGDASAFLSDFTLTSVSRVEVLRGSGSSLYGTNAIGGTIDFQTPKPQSGLHGQFGGAFGGLGLGRFRGNLSQGWDKIGVNLGFSRTSFTKGIDGQDDANNTNLQSRIEFNPFKSTNISARFFFSDADVRLNASPDTFGTLPPSNATIIDANPRINFATDANDPDNLQKSRFFNGQLAATQTIGEKLIVRGFYSGLTTRRRNDNGLLGPGFQSASTSVFEGTINTANAQAIFTPNEVHQTTFGFEFERETYSNEGFTPSGSGNFFTRAAQRSETVYAQHLVNLFGGALQLAGGVRGQFFSLDRPVFSRSNAPYATVALTNPPRAVTFDGAVSYLVRKTGTKLRAHVGNGYRVPSLYERFGTFYSSFSSAFVALGDPALRPEKTIAVDGGVDQTFWQQRARIGATYFYTKLDETIGFGKVVPAIGSTTRPFGGYLNTKGGVARGFELESKIRPSRTTDIFASYTFTNSDQRLAPVTGNSNLKTLGVPDHQFSLVATQRFGRAWINFDLLATSDYLAPIFSNSTFSTYVYRFNGNRRGDLTGGYTFPLKGDLTMRLFGTAENLFDNEYYENGFRTSGITGRVGVSFGF